jgi:hypothetical protein
VFGRRKLVHIDAQFCDEGSSGHCFDTGNRLQQPHGLLIGLQSLLDLCFQLGDGCLEEVHMRQDLPQEHLVIGPELSAERLA